MQVNAIGIAVKIRKRDGRSDGGIATKSPGRRHCPIAACCLISYLSKDSLPHQIQFDRRAHLESFKPNIMLKK
jgi:hypothetical protein